MLTGQFLLIRSILLEISNRLNNAADNIKGTSKRMKIMMSTPQGKQTLAIAGIIIIFFCAVWILLSKSSSKTSPPPTS